MKRSFDKLIFSVTVTEESLTVYDRERSATGKTSYQ